MVPVFTRPCLLVSPPTRPRAQAGMDNPCRRYPARHRDHSPRHGSLLRDEPPDASWPAPVLRHRILDRLLDQRDGNRALFAFRTASTTARVRARASRRLQYPVIAALIVRI